MPVWFMATQAAIQLIEAIMPILGHPHASGHDPIDPAQIPAEVKAQMALRHAALHEPDGE